MHEVGYMRRVCTADKKVLVLNAMTGQDSATRTPPFNDAIRLTEAVLTKMDGKRRSGAAFPVQQVSGASIKFNGVGEKLEKLEPFYRERMTSHILEMAHMVTFVEMAEEQVNEKDSEKMTKENDGTEI